jgi:hypothetical protein
MGGMVGALGSSTLPLLMIFIFNKEYVNLNENDVPNSSFFIGFIFIAIAG